MRAMQILPNAQLIVYPDSNHGSQYLPRLPVRSPSDPSAPARPMASEGVLPLAVQGARTLVDGDDRDRRQVPSALCQSGYHTTVQIEGCVDIVMVMLLPLIHRTVDVRMWLQYAVPIQAFSLAVATADGTVVALFGGASR